MTPWKEAHGGDLSKAMQKKRGQLPIATEFQAPPSQNNCGPGCYGQLLHLSFAQVLMNLPHTFSCTLLLHQRVRKSLGIIYKRRSKPLLYIDTYNYLYQQNIKLYNINNAVTSKAVKQI